MDDCADNVAGEYCAIDNSGKRKGKRSLGEMEQEFLEALSSFYFDKKPLLSDEEFELLKEELLWSGSKVVILDSQEQKFLEASMAFAKGKKIMSDEEFDQMKAALKQKSSIVAAEGPRCSIRTKKMYSDATADYVRMTAINLPAVLVVLGAVFAVDDITGFELTKVLQLPPPWGTVALWGLLLPSVFVVATTLTNIAFKDSIILKGPCPNCGAENFTYFGEVLSVAGNRGSNVVDCHGCGAGLAFDENKRVIVVDETPEVKQAKAAAAAAKKAAGKKKAAPPA